MRDDILVAVKVFFLSIFFSSLVVVFLFIWSSHGHCVLDGSCNIDMSYISAQFHQIIQLFDLCVLDSISVFFVVVVFIEKKISSATLCAMAWINIVSRTEYSFSFNCEYYFIVYFTWCFVLFFGFYAWYRFHCNKSVSSRCEKKQLRHELHFRKSGPLLLKSMSIIFEVQPHWNVHMDADEMKSIYRSGNGTFLLNCFVIYVLHSWQRLLASGHTPDIYATSTFDALLPWIHHCPSMN